MITRKRLKALVYDPLYVIRNSVLFFFGTVLYFVVTGTLNQSSLLALLGFLISYTAIYYINDLKDYDEDKKDKYKWVSKPLLNGALSKKEAKFMIVLYLAVGFAISFSISALFGSIVVAMIILNLFHTYLFKKSYVMLFLNMILIQSFKVIAGWVSVLLTLKAAIDFDVDIRNHDPKRTWDQGYADN